MGLLDEGDEEDVLDEILPPAEGGEGGAKGKGAKGKGPKGEDKDDPHGPVHGGEPDPSYTITPDPDSPEALDVKLDE